MLQLNGSSFQRIVCLFLVCHSLSRAFIDLKTAVYTPLAVLCSDNKAKIVKGNITPVAR